MDDYRSKMSALISSLSARLNGDTPPMTEEQLAELRASMKAEEDAAREALRRFAASDECERLWRSIAVGRMTSTAARSDLSRIVAGTLEDTRAIRLARKWLSGDKPILVLLGPPGTGKTVAATWLAVESMRDRVEHSLRRMLPDATPGDERQRTKETLDYAVRRLPHTVPASRVPQTFDPWRGESPEALPWEHPFVVVDDLGTEQINARWTEAFGTLIDARLHAGAGHVRTVITTNLAKGDIRARYGDRIADRFNAHSLCVELRGESMRGTGQGL